MSGLSWCAGRAAPDAGGLTVPGSSFLSAGADRLPIPAQLVEELVDGVQVAGAGDLVVDVRADGEVEHTQAERREDHRSVRRDGDLAGHHVVECAVQEVAAAGELFGQVR